MIVKMKKVTVLVSEPHRQELLLKLRGLGTVHIKNLSKPQAEELHDAEETISNVENAIFILNRYDAQGDREKIDWTKDEIPVNAKKINSITKEKEDIIKTLQDTEDKMEWFKPWGGFNPEEFHKLQEKGIFIRLYRVTKGAFKKIKEKKGIHIINKDKEYLYIAQITKDPGDKLPLEDVKPLKESYEDLSKRHEFLRRRIEEIDIELRNKARAKDSLEGYLSALKKRYEFLNVKHGMKAEHKFSYLQGFCPVDKIKDLVRLSASLGFGYMVEEPDNAAEVPTLIRNPKWINIINPVFKFMNTVPGYKEFDISLWFLIFFSIFFAMLIGDAGYGALFLVLTTVARILAKKAPREPFLLMYVLSISTIAWGAITGTWFGAEKIAELPYLAPMVVNNINSFVDTNQNFMIFICFVIGVIHLTIAHLILAFKTINSFKALSEIGWILMLWGLFFTAGTLVLGNPFPFFAKYLLIVGAVLILLFTNPQKNILKALSDVVSYLRLFAVGYASVVLANTFNEMALGLGFNGIITGLGAAFILFFGHTLNIMLGFMAVIVHGVRLNMLEFSGQMGMEWSGKEYAPFKEQGEAI